MSECKYQAVLSSKDGTLPTRRTKFYDDYKDALHMGEHLADNRYTVTVQTYDAITGELL